MSSSKSVWRGPNAQHFTLVHRSQQDPLLHDAEASSRVLKSAPKRQQQVGQSRADLENDLGTIAKQERKNVGEAAQYGIYLDDTEYDYMQHLRPMGGNKQLQQEENANDAEVIMLEAPKSTKQTKGKSRANEETIEFKENQNNFQLPAEVLPSKEMLPRTFEQDKQFGLRPDMDPHLRQVLEALEDDAFLMKMAGKKEQTSELQESSEDFVPIEANEVEDIDDFFGEIIKEGEFDEDQDDGDWRNLPPEGEESIYLDPSARAARELLELKKQGKDVQDLSLESRVALFKEASAAKEHLDGKRKSSAPSSVGSKSIFGEKGATRKSRHAGAKARHAASFYSPSIDGGATAFSMSSSAMERNQGLTDLDDQFARLERIYEEERDDSEEDEIATEEDNQQFDAIFDEFLSKNEVIGTRMRERLGDPNTTAMEKVDMIRQELGEMRLVDKKTWDEAQADGLGPQETVEQLISRDLKQRKDARNRWDVETIQSTRTNLENHPTTIAASQSVVPSRISVNNQDGNIIDKMPKIKIDPRTGKAQVNGHIKIGARQARRKEVEEQNIKDEDKLNDDEEEDSETDSDITEKDSIPAVLKRNRNETKEEKRLRKSAIKLEKRNRKEEKQQRKAAFQQAMQTHQRTAQKSISGEAGGNFVQNSAISLH